MKKLLIILFVFISFWVLGGEKPLKDTVINGCTFVIYGNKKGDRYIYVRKQNQPRVTYKLFLLDSGKTRMVFYKGYQTFL